ncbi:MAG: zf-HC2 domain-containing protein, partial [Candidatus Zixiibacteriota bacterium]
MINCLQALEKLYDYVDGELPPADRAAVQEHLEACRPCLTHFEFETLFSDFVRRRATLPAAREAFKDRLFTRLRDEQRMYAPVALKDAGRRWSFAVAAAVFLLLAVAGMRLPGPPGSG